MECERASLSAPSDAGLEIIKVSAVLVFDNNCNLGVHEVASLHDGNIVLRAGIKVFREDRPG